jgi:flagellar basal body-associated protein FliL
VLKKAIHSIGGKKTYIIVIAIVIAYIAYAVSLFTWCRGYYTYEDVFGPLSKHVAIAISIALFLLASFLYLYFFYGKRGDGGRGSILPIIVLVLSITSIRLLPDVVESYYNQDFSDAGEHMTRGTFVAPNRKGFLQVYDAILKRHINMLWD